LAQDLPPIEADPNQIKQAVDNLLINANQAMPMGGTITIRTERIVADNGSPSIRVTITDQGGGIPPDHLPHIFDPFFTTKFTGHGLGLTTAHSIITRHGGRIDVSSRLGMGTTFTIDLPVSGKSLPSLPPPVSTDSPRNLRVLVMDDELFIRDLTGSLLEMVGGRMQAVKNGLEAIEAYSQAMKGGQPFDLVILDLTIPGGMGGIDTLEVLKKIDPAIRAIVSSGYSEDPVMANPTDFGFAASLPKPYRLAAFKDALRQAMGR
jgi:CheY-like chemotaxis protein